MIKCDNLTVVYPDNTEALLGVSFAVKAGERAALLGANGAGKSTLLFALSGVIPFSSGSVTVDGIDLTDKSVKSVRTRLGFIFQNPDDQLFMPVTEEDAAFTLASRGEKEEDIEEKLSCLFSRLKITHLRKKHTHRLSGGEKRCVALAGVLIAEPSVLLLDEPTSFLDPAARGRVIDILAGLPQTALIATHDLDMALGLTERTILLERGKILADGNTREILGDKALLEKAGLLHARSPLPSPQI